MNVTTTRAAYSVLVLLCSLPVAACGNGTPPAAPPVANAPPATGAVAEHPELGEAAVTEDSLTTAIATHLQAETARLGGAFTIDDPAQKRQLRLSLITVHREGTRRLPDGRYFACADFKGADGDTYDLDLFMKQDLNGLTADEVVIHKQDGQARYDWAQAAGVWQRVPVPSK